MQVLAAYDHFHGSTPPKIAAFVGASPFITAMVQEWLALNAPVRTVPLDENHVDLAIMPLMGSQSVWVRGGLDSMTMKDMVALRAIAQIAPVLVTGEKWGDAQVKEWWETRKGATFRLYDDIRTGTPGAHKVMERWVQRTTGVHVSLAKYVCKRLDHQEFALAEFIKRTKFFSSEVLTSSLVDVLSFDLCDGDLAEDILFLRGAQALRNGREAPASISRALRRLPAKVALLSRMYPIVMRYPKVSVEASKESKIPLPVLAHYWATAGQYDPHAVVFRLRLLSSLSEYSRHDFAALAVLVALW